MEAGLKISRIDVVGKRSDFEFLSRRAGELPFYHGEMGRCAWQWLVQLVRRGPGKPVVCSPLGYAMLFVMGMLFSNRRVQKLFVNKIKSIAGQSDVKEWQWLRFTRRRYVRDAAREETVVSLEKVRRFLNNNIYFSVR